MVRRHTGPFSQGALPSHPWAGDTGLKVTGTRYRAHMFRLKITTLLAAWLFRVRVGKGT